MKSITRVPLKISSILTNSASPLVTEADSLPTDDHNPTVALGEQPREAADDGTDTAAAVTTGEPPDNSDADSDTSAAAAEPATADVVPVYSLTDPDTWRNILDNGFRENRSLTYMWKNDLAPLIGVSYPYGETKLDLDTLESIATHLRAFGVALKDYKINAKGMSNITENLHHCCDLSVQFHIKTSNVYYYLNKKECGAATFNISLVFVHLGHKGKKSCIFF
jgi:hypothetical protein